MCFNFSNNGAKLILCETIDQMKYDPIATFALSKTNESMIIWLKQKYSWISRWIKRLDASSSCSNGSICSRSNTEK